MRGIVNALGGSGLERDVPLSFQWRTGGDLWSEVLDLSPAPTRRHDIARNSVLLASLVEAHGQDRCISYSRNKNFYAGKRRYFGTAYTYLTVVWAVDDLDEANWLDTWIAPPGKSRGRQSVLRATPDLLLATTLPPHDYNVHELVRLKNREGSLIDYRNNERTCHMRRELMEINESVGGLHIALDVPGAVVNGTLIQFPPAQGKAGAAVVNTAKIFLYRVFNGGWARGGRLYGHWVQNVPKVYRNDIRMDGSPTIELDYPHLHPTLLYSLAGVLLDGDPYEIEGWERSVAKRALNIIFNALTYRSALGAVAAALRKRLIDEDDGYFYFDGNIYQDEAACREAARLIRALKDRHRPIARYFHSGVGLELQYLDSQMACAVMHSMRKRGVVAVPVHDSFVVPANDEGPLLEAMDVALKEAQNGRKWIRA